MNVTLQTTLYTISTTRPGGQCHQLFKYFVVTVPSSHPKMSKTTQRSRHLHWSLYWTGSEDARTFFFCPMGKHCRLRNDFSTAKLILLPFHIELTRIDMDAANERPHQGLCSWTPLGSVTGGTAPRHSFLSSRFK